MPTLFVDCDNTLYAARPGANLRGSSGWEANWVVVAAMERWQRAGRGPIVIWSGAGEADAELWRRRIVPHMPDIETGVKDLLRPAIDDILIDDVRLATNGTCYQPAQCFLIAPSD